jgi:hypothetical protein
MLFLLSCEPCPDPEDRFDPLVEPEEQVTLKDGVNPKGVCGSPEGDFPMPRFVHGGEVVIVNCTDSWCIDGFEGLYCSEQEHFFDWRSQNCPFCDLNVSHADNMDLYSICTP